MTTMIDTSGYELRRLPWWYSPLTKKQVHIDTFSALMYWREITETDLTAFLRERGFIGEQYLLLEGEFDRRELQERVGMFRVDPKKPTIIRRVEPSKLRVQFEDVQRRLIWIEGEITEEARRAPPVERLLRLIGEREELRKEHDRLAEAVIKEKPSYIEEELTSYTIIEKLELLRIFLTFSIETGIEPPLPAPKVFYAEVTCDTVITSDLPEDKLKEITRRIVNGVLKFFFIVFDGGKIVFTGKQRTDRDPEWLIKTLAYLQFFAKPIYEGGEIDRKEQKGGMDGFLKMLMDRITARDDFDEYITRESIIAIGIEYESTANMDYMYPSIHVDIEKTKTGHYHVERTLILAPITDVWMDKILDMVVS